MFYDKTTKFYAVSKQIPLKKLARKVEIQVTVELEISLFLVCVTLWNFFNTNILL
jgi:hypothetical protein